MRTDGREMGAARPTTVHSGAIATADGSALVTLGAGLLLAHDPHL
jgi:exosome complex RNA-binding protein Rrp42 (RNase PH superfamily)